MCYAKPGPRCSTHADAALEAVKIRLRERLAKAREAHEEGRESDARRYEREAEAWRKRVQERAAEYAETPEALRFIGEHYDEQPNGAARFAMAQQVRARKLADYHAHEREKKALVEEQQREYAKRLRGNANPTEEERRAAMDGLSALERVHRAQKRVNARGGSTGFKPRDRWAEKYTYDSRLKGASTADLHSLAVQALRGDLEDVDANFLAVLCKRPNASTETVRMVARATENLETRSQAFDALAVKLSRRSPERAEDRPTALPDDAETVEGTLPNHLYIEHLERAFDKRIDGHPQINVDNAIRKRNRRLAKERQRFPEHTPSA